MVMVSGVHASLHSHCHYNSFCSMAFLSGELWSINRAVDLSEYESALIDVNVNEQVSVFNNAITNLLQMKLLLLTIEELGEPPCNRRVTRNF